MCCPSSAATCSGSVSAAVSAAQARRHSPAAPTGVRPRSAGASGEDQLGPLMLGADRTSQKREAATRAVAHLADPAPSGSMICPSRSGQLINHSFSPGFASSRTMSGGTAPARPTLRRVFASTLSLSEDNRRSASSALARRDTTVVRRTRPNRVHLRVKPVDEFTGGELSLLGELPERFRDAHARSDHSAEHDGVLQSALALDRTPRCLRGRRARKLPASVLEVAVKACVPSIRICSVFLGPTSGLFGCVERLRGIMAGSNLEPFEHEREAIHDRAAHTSPHPSRPTTSCSPRTASVALAASAKAFIQWGHRRVEVLERFGCEFLLRLAG